MFATGPSLTEEVVELVRPYHNDNKIIAIGCNDTYRIVDYLDILYACDGTWWDYHIKHGTVLEYQTEKWTQEKRITTANDGINFIPGTHQNGFSLDPSKIHYGSNSGYQQLNLAYLMGIRKFLLVGYNMGAGGNTHFFGLHPKGLNRTSPYARFVQAYTTIQPEIQKMIINCTEPSALTVFKKQELKEALEEL